MVAMAQDSGNQMSASPLIWKVLASSQNPPSPNSTPQATSPGKHIPLTQLPYMNLGAPSILTSLTPPRTQMIKPSPTDYTFFSFLLTSLPVPLLFLHLC